MQNSGSIWEKRRVPYDPRQLDGTMVIEDEHGTNEAVAVLEQYLPKAHTRVAGFAECTLEEGRYFNSTPSTEEERVLLMKREVLSKYEDQVCEAQIEIDEEVLPELERLEYELEIVRRVKEKNVDKSIDTDLQVQVEALESMIGNQQRQLEEMRAEIERKELILSEIERDIEEGA